MCAFRADLVLPAGAVFAVVSRLRDHERVGVDREAPDVQLTGLRPH